MTVIDTWSKFTSSFKFTLVINPRFNYKREDVVRTLDHACKQYGYPKVIRVDNGSEFISKDMDVWAYHNHVILDSCDIGFMSPWTSLDQESLRIMPSSKAIIYKWGQVPTGMFEHTLVYEP